MSLPGVIPECEASSNSCALLDVGPLRCRDDKNIPANYRITKLCVSPFFLSFLGSTLHFDLSIVYSSECDKTYMIGIHIHLIMYVACLCLRSIYVPCQKENPSWLPVRQAPYLLYYASDFIFGIFLNYDMESYHRHSLPIYYSS